MKTEIFIPHQATLSEWYKNYTEFGNIFLSAEIDYLFSFDTKSIISNRSEFIFEYMMQYYFSRIVLPELTFVREIDIHSINKIKSAIDKESRILYFKYKILSETVSPELSDYLENYKITRERTSDKTYGVGTIRHSGDDVMQNSSNVKTTHNTSTGESETPRYEYDNVTATQGSADNNQVKTSYGKIITSSPGTEGIDETTVSHGFYNSGTRADMIREIREIADFNIIKNWLNDMLSCFCLNTYRPEHTQSSEFVL